MTKDKAFKTEHTEMLQQAFRDNPLLYKAKKFILVMLIIWDSIRSLDVIAAVVFTLVLNRGVTTLLLSVWSIIIVFLFSAAIYSGYRIFAVLPIIGGIQLIMTFVLNFNNILMAVTAGDLLYITVSVFSVFGGLAQIIIMIIILANKKCNAYFKTVDGIMRQLSARKKPM